MDALVAKYRRPAGMMQEAFGEEEVQEMMGLENPGLSLKFAMPVAHVSVHHYPTHSNPHADRETEGVAKY